MRHDITQQASPFIPPSYPGDCDTCSVEMFGTEENDADPAQIKQLHLVIVSPVYLDDSNLADQCCDWPVTARHSHSLPYPGLC